MEKQAIYDEISSLLTEYETDEKKEDTDWGSIFYKMLVSVQSNWEDIITAEEDYAKD